MPKPNELPWSERVPMLAINPDAATRYDVARMAANLVDCDKEILRLQQVIFDLTNKG